MTDSCEHSWIACDGGGGGRHDLYTVPTWTLFPYTRSHVTILGQSVSMPRYRAHSETCDQILLSVRRLFSESYCLVSVGRPLWREVGSVICSSQSVVIYQYLHQAFTLHVFYSSVIYVQCIFIQSRLSTADYALVVIISPNYRSSLDTWTVVWMTAAKFKPFMFSVWGFALSNFACNIQGEPDSIRQYLIINNQSIQQHTGKWDGSCHLSTTKGTFPFPRVLLD
jgi:hypothetical protein